MSTLLAPSEPVYAEDWFSHAIPAWTAMLAHLHPHRQPRLLEIGAFEGRATRWMLEHFPKAHVTVIDPFTGGSDQQHLDLMNLRGRFDHNTAPFRDRLRVMQDTSAKVLPILLTGDWRFDFIYIDGSHEAADVLFDAVCAFRLLTDDGRICFDDFCWGLGHPGYRQEYLPRAAIIPFLATHGDRVTMPRPPNEQLWIARIPTQGVA
jgi:predicted O-methyltransferase YrrM